DSASPKRKQFSLGPDGLHLTSGGFALVADYMANIVLAPDTIAVQPAITAAATSNFTGAVLGRLDALRERNTISELRGGLKDVGYGGPATRPQNSRVTGYNIRTFPSGNHHAAPH